MGAEICKYVIIVLAIFNFGFMLFDGTKALVKGDYIRPKTGDYAGQLGPWHKLVSALGIDPMSTAMKTVFVVWGLSGFSVALCFLLYPTSAWAALLVVNVLSLWYLWVGTISCILQIILLFIWQNL